LVCCFTCDMFDCQNHLHHSYHFQCSTPFCASWLTLLRRTQALSGHFSWTSNDTLVYLIWCNNVQHRFDSPDGASEKTQLYIEMADPNSIDLSRVIEQIAALSPVDLNHFSATFSTTTFESNLALRAAFCDAMSTFYQYNTYRCGIPRVRILGLLSSFKWTVNHSDWWLILTCI